MPLESKVRATSVRRRSKSVSDSEENPLIHEVMMQMETAVQLLSVATNELEACKSALAVGRREKAAERSRYRELLEIAGISHLVTDIQGRIQKTNECTESLLNTSATELVGKPLVVFIEEAERRQFNDDLRGRFLVARKFRKKLRIQPRQSPSITVTATLDVLRDDSGRPFGFQWWFMEAETTSIPRTTSAPLLLSAG